MARDLFKEAGIAPEGGRDLFAEAGITPEQPKQGFNPEAAFRASGELAKEAWGGVVEPLLKMGTGTIAKPVSDVMGLSALARALITGDKNADVSGFKDYIQRVLTYEPRTIAGQSQYNPLNAIPNAIGSVISGGANKVADLVAGENPSMVRSMAADATREAIPHALAIAGVKYGPKASASTNKVIQKREAFKKQEAALRLQKDANIIEAKADKMILPPSEAAAGRFANYAEGMSGRGKLLEQISNKNAARNAERLRNDMGLDKYTPLTKESLQEIVDMKGAVYNEIREIGKPFVADKKYISDWVVLKNKMQQMRKNNTTWNPEYASVLDDLSKGKIDAPEAVELMKSLRANASQNIAAVEKGVAAKPNQLAIGKFQKDAAKAIEDLVQRNLEKQGRGDLGARFKDARVSIAKAKTLQKVVDENGMVDATKLESLRQRGAYMSGEMEKVARFGAAFRDVAGKTKSGASVPVTGWEGMIAAGGVGASMFTPAGLAMMGIPVARAGTRAFISSPLGQRMVGRPKTYSPSILSESLKYLEQLPPATQQAILYPVLAPKE